MIRIVLAEDQALVRAGLVALLGAEPGLAVVEAVADGEAALEAARRVRPDVLVLDVRMPRRDGISVVAELGRLGLGVPAILLTTFEDDAALIAGVRAGARGFLLKDVEVGPLVAAIRRVAAGEDAFGPGAGERIVSALRGRAAADGAPVAALTRRERQILGLMSAGLSNPDIAEALGIGHGTVKNHVSVVLEKLGVGDRTRAVLKAAQLGLV